MDIILKITPKSSCTSDVIDKQITTIVNEQDLLEIGFSEKEVERVTVGWDINELKYSDYNFTYTIQPRYSQENSYTVSTIRTDKNIIMMEIRALRDVEIKKSDIKFVGLHAHSGVGSPFDGFGYPQDHMEFCYNNGGQALALTDHGNMNGFAYQLLQAKKMKKEGKNFKPIFGVEAYFIPCVNQWRKEYEEHKADKKKAKALSQDQSGVNVEEEGATKAKGRSINRSRHLVLIAMNQTGLNNIFKLVSESYSEKYFYRKPRMDYQLLSKYSDGVIAMAKNGLSTS
jgi:DNA polymerase III alpha subunit (gram-positive type)